MHSKNKKAMTTAERAHVERVKSIDCSVCDVCGPLDAHEIEQGLCRDCHTNPVLGIHGQKRAWAVRKLDEIKALNITLLRVYGGG